MKTSYPGRNLAALFLAARASRHSHFTSIRIESLFRNPAGRPPSPVKFNKSPQNKA